MGNEIAHMGVVDGALGFGLPGGKGGGIIGEHANDMDVVHIPKDVLLWRDKFTTKHKVKALGHGMVRFVLLHDILRVADQRGKANKIYPFEQTKWFDIGGRPASLVVLRLYHWGVSLGVKHHGIAGG